MRIAPALAAIALVAAAGTAHADFLVGYWNMNTGQASGQAAPLTIAAAFAANPGVADLTTNFDPNGYKVFTPIGASAHNGLNGLALYGDVNGNDLGLQNGAAGVNNGKYIQFQFNTASYADFTLTFAGRRTSTGFTSFDVSTSTNGVNFSPAGSITTIVATGYSLITFDLNATIDNAATAYVRLTSVGTSTSSGGNVRIDNVQFNATVPAPGAAALLALGGLVATRRRR